MHDLKSRRSDPVFKQREPVVKQLVIVLHAEDMDEALYVDGRLKLHGIDVHACDIADAAENSLCRVEYFTGSLDGDDWPESLEQIKRLPEGETDG